MNNTVSDDMLKKYKNIHKGETIYVLSSGKSVDFMDCNFFSDKITIGVNQVYKKFVPKYLLRKEHVFFEEILNLNLDTTHFISAGNCGGNGSSNIIEQIHNKYKNSNIVMYNHNINKNKLDKLPENDDSLVVSHSTITTAIHLAAYMGAKYIFLIGHDCGTLDGESNFSGYHTDKTLKIAHKSSKISAEEKYRNWLKGIEDHTITLKKLLKEKYGCEVYSLNPFINFGLEGHNYKR